MNIGDKVRMLRGREEGVVTRLLEGQLVEVEIEEGFKIPVLRSELAVVVADEGRLMGRPADAAAPAAPAGKFSGPVLATRGVYLAFVSVNDREMSLYVLNNTDWEIPFTLGEEADGKYKGTAAGVLKRKTSLKTREVLINEFEQWPIFVLQLLFHREGFGTVPAPLVKRMRFRANTFFKSKQKAPLLDREAHLFQVDEETVVIQPEKILDRMRENTAPVPAIAVTKPASVVDLHIEQLTGDSAKMSNSAMLQLQLDTFEKQLESAIATGMADITFIHGLGNGTLRTELHKRLGRHPHVQYYEDAQKEKFGYGATKVKIK
ncbi:MAG: Smr/MutS family protein [Ferruginibacter sp.]|nr:Smr/MutS family protein [Cytophagales bacterium]